MCVSQRFLRKNQFMHLTIIAGARPNFVKIAPIIHAIRRHNDRDAAKIDFCLVHTGQHYDEKMSGSFFKDLNIPLPDVNLNVGSHSHAEQTAKIMVAFEKHLMNQSTDCVLVVGDVNSTMACAIVAKKLGVKVVHVEGGLRSRDMRMPEEINRLLTDSITDYFFTTSALADTNLLNEGVTADRIFMVGNTMIDSLVNSLDKAVMPKVEHDIATAEYILLTLHRPSNVDDAHKLETLIETIDRIASGVKVLFPIHPRTASKLTNIERFDNIEFLSPLPYLEFLYLMKNAKAVVTDSGGIQEETTYLKVPCLTLRENTERPETIEIGSNQLIGNDLVALEKSLTAILSGNWKKGEVPPLWDGNASKRIVDHLAQLFN